MKTRFENPTVGLLYPGELGAALTPFFANSGFRVVTTTVNRSERTSELAKACGCELLNSIDDVVQRADIVVSAVPSIAAEDIAIAVCECRPIQDLIFVDINSTSPSLAKRIAQHCSAAGVTFVDAAVRGLADRLEKQGIVYLSGAIAADVVPLFQPLEIEIVGDRPGDASRMKMMLSGMSKGIATLFLEMAITAQRNGMLSQFLVSVERHYKDVFLAMQAVIPTYPRHALRRAHELTQVSEFQKEVDLPSDVVTGCASFLSHLSSTDISTESVPLSDASLDVVIAAISDAISRRAKPSD